MTRILFASIMLILMSSIGLAQAPMAPGAMPGQYLPNIYNRPYQPLSPYLNLLRGGNPGVNYFYGVRPGTQGAVPVGGGFGPMGFGSGFNRTNVLPTTLAATSEPIPIDPAGVPIPMLSPTGHPVSFGPGPGRVAPGTGMNRPGFQRGGVPPTAPQTNRR